MNEPIKEIISEYEASTKIMRDAIIAANLEIERIEKSCGIYQLVENDIKKLKDSMDGMIIVVGCNSKFIEKLNLLLEAGK